MKKKLTAMFLAASAALAPALCAAQSCITDVMVVGGENKSVTNSYAAQAQWGGDCRMPTDQELNDLVNNCDWIWTTMNGVNGYEVRGRGDYASASIFLPCAGCGEGTSLSNADSLGYFWSSVPNSDGNYYAWSLYFNSSDHYTYYNRRYRGQSVRPVQWFTE